MKETHHIEIHREVVKPFSRITRYEVWGRHKETHEVTVLFQAFNEERAWQYCYNELGCKPHEIQRNW